MSPQRTRFKAIMIVVGVLFVVLTLITYTQRVTGQATPPFHYPSIENPIGTQANLGAVGSESSICTQIGIDLIKGGGNAADALVGTVFCVGVTAMYHSGIGGGGFMLVRSPNGTYEFVDFRETAPAAAFEDMFEGNEKGSLVGGLACGVPGELRGLEYLHSHYGHLPWKTVMAPAIRIARFGFPVTEDLVQFMDWATKDMPDFFVEDPSWAIDFAPNGTRVGLGDVMSRKRYADTLEKISDRGPDAFYSGPIAEATISALQSQNGIMSMEDLRNYSVIVREPLQIKYRDYRLFAGSAPSSGPVALSVMKTMEQYSDFGETETVHLSTHRLDEALRFAYAQRVKMGDPSFVPAMIDYQQEMISEETAARVKNKISDDRTLNVSAYNPDRLKEFTDRGTAQVVAVDAKGLAISATTTINYVFGSMIISSTGVIMNSEMDDFSSPNTTNQYGYKASPANFIRPGKRPLSSISPIIVEFFSNSTVYTVIGAAGGSRIISSVVQNLWFILDRGMSGPEAVAQPRLHDQLIPNQVEFDYTFDNNTVDFMKGREHNVTWVNPCIALVQAVRRLPNGTFEAAGDPCLHNGAGYAI